MGYVVSQDGVSAHEHIYNTIYPGAILLYREVYSNLSNCSLTILVDVFDSLHTVGKSRMTQKLLTQTMKKR